MKKDPGLAFLSEVSSVLLQQALRHQHTAFSAFFARRARHPPGHAVGVDLGAKDFAVTSDGEKIANPPHLDRKARSAWRDFLHRTSTRLVRENDIIVIEDLNVSGMVRNRRLARAISDCDWGEFRRQLEYKCERARHELVVIDRWYPSSKTCSACGHLLAGLSLSTRHWTCPFCRARHDRDINAAKNILAAGLAAARGSPGDACRADVRHPGSSRMQSALKQEPRPARAGIPVPQGGE
jgi:putative transposase